MGYAILPKIKDVLNQDLFLTLNSFRHMVSYQESYHLSMFVIKNSFSRLIQKKELSLFWINKNKNHELIPHCIFVRNKQKRTSL